MVPPFIDSKMLFCSRGVFFIVRGINYEGVDRTQNNCLCGVIVPPYKLIVKNHPKGYLFY